MAVAVQISDRSSDGTTPYSIGGMCGKGAVAIVEQYGYGIVIAVGHGQVVAAVAVEIPDGYIVCVRSGRIGDPGSKCPVTIVYQHRDRIGTAIAGDHIGVAVAIEVTDIHSSATIHRIIDRGGEGAVPIVGIYRYTRAVG